MGAEFHTDRKADGRTDMTKCIVAFYKFANASKNNLLRRQFELKGKENSILLIVELNRLHDSRETIVQINSGTLN